MIRKEFVMTMENVFVQISLVSRKINRKNVFGKNPAITVLKMQFAKMGNVPASGAIQEKTSNHFISDFFLILIGSNKSKWTIAQKRSLKQNHWTWDSNIWSWKGNGKTCENLNECETNTHDCKEPAICHDLDGTYDCKCPRGYRRHTTVSWLPVFRTGWRWCE